MQDNFTSGHGGQNITPEGLYLMDGIEGLRSLPRHSVDMLLTDPPYGTTRNYWDVPLPLPELWEAVRWAVIDADGTFVNKLAKNKCRPWRRLFFSALVTLYHTTVEKHIKHIENFY